MLRGRNVPTEVFEVLDAADPRVAHLAIYGEGIERLRAGDLAEARASFERVLSHGPDPVAEHQLARAKA